MSLISFVYCLSYAALMFSGPLASGLPQGVGALMIGAAVTGLAVAMFSGFRAGISGPDGNACAVMATMGAAIAHDLLVTGDPRFAVANVLCLLALMTLITGAVVLALGYWRAGRWIRFIPYPVVGGLVAAAGALIILGAARVVWPLDTSYSLPVLIGTAAVMPQYLLALVWAAVLAVCLPRLRGPLGLPVLLAVGVAGFHVVLWSAGIPMDTARVEGWLFNSPSGSGLWTPWTPGALQETEWLLLLGRIGDAGTLVFVTTLTLLINATGLEVETRTDADLDRELMLNGGANIVSSLMGGYLSFISMSRSLINYKLGATSRVSGIVFVASTLLLALVGMEVIGYLPRAVLGGTLFYFGLTLLSRWAFQSRRQLSVPDYLALLVILGVTVVLGFGYGLLVGVLAGCVMFVVNYSRLHVIKFRFSGNDFRSSHERSAEDKALLTRHGHDIRVFVLQGFIFFGMADRLYRTVTDEAFGTAGRAKMLVLDLANVHGVDASAIASFKKISYVARQSGARFITTSLRRDYADEWRASHDADLSSISHLPDLDAGMEWCENQLLSEYRDEQGVPVASIADWMRGEMHDASGRLVECMERLVLAPGDVLCRQDEPADGMYFIESGRVAIELVLPDGRSRRLRTLGPRTVLGEMGLYRTATRSANAVVQEPSVVYRLGADAIRMLEAQEPEAAARFHAMVVRTVADRLEFSNALVAALQR